MVKLVVLDFDGTLTDPWKNVDKFEEAYVAAFKNILGDDGKFAKYWQDAKACVFAAPENYGLEWNGKLSSAATDPYLIYSAAAGIVLKVCSRLDPKKLSEVFQSAYSVQPADFKPDAEKFVRELKSRSHVVIITNSKTDKITARMQSIGQEVPVYGNATKFIMDSEWNDVPESLMLKNLNRPALLRRGFYYDALTRALDDTAWKDLLVVGDSYELDLLLPAYFGARVALIDTKGTLEYERIAARKNGIVAKSLGEVLDYAR
jgi:phosphoglycolate phosphatase-like HAD superfamily hydrolase